jgi:hypothetical protein
MAALLVRLVLPELPAQAQALALLLGLILAAFGVGLVESSMARLKLVNVPHLLVAAFCAAAFGLILTLR